MSNCNNIQTNIHNNNVIISTKQMKDDRRLWYGLVILGSLSLINAMISTLMKPQDYVSHYRVIGVHWINTIILLAGLAPFVFPQKTLKSETAIIVTNILSLCITCSCALADISNIFTVIFGKSDWTSYFSILISDEEIDTRRHLFVYNCIDMAICVLASCFSHQMIGNRLKVSPIAHMVDSRRLQGFGIALIIMSSLGIFNHGWQRLIMSHHKLAIFLDTHTIDEFSWLVINLTTGILVFLSSKGNQLVQGASFVLSGATIYPSFFYAWLDYRVMTSTHSKFLFKQAMISTCISIPHIAVLLAIFLMFTMSMRDTIHIQLRLSHKIIFGSFSLFFFIIAASLVDVSFYALFTKQFYRIFHSSEQKLPFLAAFLGIFTGISVISKFNFVSISVSLVVGILAVNATYLHNFSYIYLRWNGYFIDQTNLDFLVLPSDKFENGTETSMVHNVETSINVISLFGAFSLVTFLFYLCRTHVVQTEIVEESDTMVEKEKYEKRVLILGVFMLIGSLVVLILAFYIFVTSDVHHPLVTIYSQIFQIVLGLSVTTFALFQVLVAERLSKYPLLSLSLLLISTIRALDILTQIDYKDVGAQPMVWLIHAFIEYISVFAHFLTIASVINVQGAGRKLIEPAEIPMSFDNPLGNETDENGYIQLRTNIENDGNLDI